MTNTIPGNLETLDSLIRDRVITRADLHCLNCSDTRVTITETVVTCAEPSCAHVEPTTRFLAAILYAHVRLNLVRVTRAA